MNTDYTLTDLIWAALIGGSAAFVYGFAIAAWRDWKGRR